MITVKSNAAALMAAVVSKNLKLGEAAQMCGINADLFGQCARLDRRISPKTAGCLKKAFGDDVIILSTDAKKLQK